MYYATRRNMTDGTTQVIETKHLMKVLIMADADYKLHRGQYRWTLRSRA